jgi:hypothetical protein
MSSSHVIWEELAAALPAGRPGRMERGIHPGAVADMRLAIDNPGGIRSLALTVSSEAVRNIEAVPEASGLRSTLHAGGGPEATLEIALDDPGSQDIFGVLVDDVSEHVAPAEDEETAVEVWVGRLRRWQRFLQRAQSGLNPERQRGLFAELWVLREVMVPALGMPSAVAAWTGPEGTVHDFQTNAAHVEVKSSVAGQPQVARINGERQLDETGTPGLWLIHLSLSVARDFGETLPQMIGGVRALASGEPVNVQLEDRLFSGGYHDAHERRYRGIGYTLRERDTFRVAEGFPRIVESDLRDGVGGVYYRIAISACAGYAVSQGELTAAIADSDGG